MEIKLFNKLSGAVDRAVFTVSIAMNWADTADNAAQRLGIKERFDIREKLADAHRYAALKADIVYGDTGRILRHLAAESEYRRPLP